MLARNVSTLPVRNTPSGPATPVRAAPRTNSRTLPEDGSSGPDTGCAVEAGRVPARVSTTRKFVWEGTRTYLLCSAARVGAPFERTSLFNASASERMASWFASPAKSKTSSGVEREHKIVLLFSLPLRPLVMTCGRKRTGRSECRGSIITAAVPSQARNSTTEDQHGKSPMRSRSSIGSRTSSLTRRDRARRVVVHLLLKGPTGPSLRRRPDLATQPDLRDLTSSSRRCARTPAGSRFSLLGISQPPCRLQRRWTRSRRSSPTTSAPSTSTRSTTRLWRGPTATPSTSAFARASTTQTRAWAAMP